MRSWRNLSSPSAVSGRLPVRGIRVVKLARDHRDHPIPTAVHEAWVEPCTSQAASRRDVLSPSESNRVSASPTSQIARQPPSPKHRPAATGFQDAVLLQTQLRRDRKLDGGSAPLVVPPLRRSALREHAHHGGRERPIRGVPWGRCVIGRVGCVALVPPQPFVLVRCGVPSLRKSDCYAPTVVKTCVPALLPPASGAGQRTSHWAVRALRDAASWMQPLGGDGWKEFSLRRRRCAGRKPGILSLGHRSPMDHGSEHPFAP